MKDGGRHRASARGGGGGSRLLEQMSARLSHTDEELGKRDDDHKPWRANSLWSQWQRGPLRYRKRRLLFALLGGFLVYLFVHNIPTDLKPARGNNPFGKPRDISLEAPTGPPPASLEDGDGGPNTDGRGEHWYDGQIKFYNLGKSLHGVSKTGGYRQLNRNVLFAAAKLQSASTLLPLACEMSRWQRNYVHFAFTGRDSVSIQDILDINGIDPGSCQVFWHDARADYPEYSTDIRAEATVAAAMNHIQTFIHPQVLIMDDSMLEETFFIKGMRVKAKEHKLPVIEIPKDGSDRFFWLTRLDAGSLRAWHKAEIDILIHAPPSATGSLMRLLKSLESADYAGLTPPRLTIELPSTIDPPTQHFLDHFIWPPARYDRTPIHTNRLTLRHRIPSAKPSTEESSVRFLESFYPTQPANSHVLLLTPQAQLASNYYHYLRYSLLEYKYSSYGSGDNKGLMGVSLELPPTLLDGKTALKAPSLAKMTTPTGWLSKLGKEHKAPFLWEAPNSNAALYFGDKWVEVHSFLTNRLAALHDDTKSSSKPKRQKLVAETYPGWMEFFLELMRARNYGMLYPVLGADEAFVTIHNELYTPPEEFMRTQQLLQSNKDEKRPDLNGEPFLTAEDPPANPSNPEAALTPSKPLHVILPFDGDLPEIPKLPFLTYHGNQAPDFRIGSGTDSEFSFASDFRRNVGACPQWPENKRRKVKPMSAADLFCFEEVPEDEFELIDIPKEESKSDAKAEESSRKSEKSGKSGAEEVNKDAHGKEKPGPVVDPDAEPPAPSLVPVQEVKEKGAEELRKSDEKKSTDNKQEKEKEKESPSEEAKSEKWEKPGIIEAAVQEVVGTS